MENNLGVNEGDSEELLEVVPEELTNEELKTLNMYYQFVLSQGQVSL